MNRDAHDPTTWREGSLGKLNGAEVISAVRNGQIWVLIQQIGTIDSRYGHLMEELFGELEERVPGLRTFSQKMSILISSPNVQVYYHCDVPGQSLWQIRGRKRVYLYPNKPPFITQKAMEKIVLGEADEQDMPYHDWFDHYASTVDLQPGEMLHWPINAPHRVVNEDCLNVSFTTEHWTPELKTLWAVNYANGLMRRALGTGDLSQATRGPASFAKYALTGLVKKSGLQDSRRMKFRIDFEVDPNKPTGYRDIPAFDIVK